MTQKPPQKNDQNQSAKPKSENADWGMDDSSSGMSSEAKIGIALVLVLVCAFGFVLHKRLGKDGRLWENIQAAIGIGEPQEEVVIAADDSETSNSDKQLEADGSNDQFQTTSNLNDFANQDFQQQQQMPPAQDQSVAAADQFQQDHFQFEQNDQHYTKSQQFQQQQQQQQQAEVPPQFDNQQTVQNDPFFDQQQVAQQHEPQQQVAQQHEPQQTPPAEFSQSPQTNSPQTNSPQTNSPQTNSPQTNIASQQYREDIPFDIAQEEMQSVPVAQKQQEFQHDSTDQQHKPEQAESLFADAPVIDEQEQHVQQTPAPEQGAAQDLFADATPTQQTPTEQSDPFAEPKQHFAEPQPKADIEYVQQPQQMAQQQDHWGHPHRTQRVQQHHNQHHNDEIDFAPQPQAAQIGFHGDGLKPQHLSAANIQVHTVRTSDNYWSISQEYYGTHRYYKALALFNLDRIGSQEYLRSGMKVLIPDAAELEKHFPQLFPPKKQHAGRKPNGFFINKYGEPMYRIGSRDNLTGIARKHLGRASRWRQIYAMNQNRLHNPNNLQIGTVLRLPADASRVAVISR